MHHRPHGDHACASCKHQRKKCKEDCMMAPFFPVQNNKQFRAVHKIFGVSNVAKQLKKHSNEQHRRLSADSLIWEASCWEDDPIQGPYGEYRRVAEELNRCKSQLCRMAASQGTMNIPAAAYHPRPAVLPNGVLINGWNNNGDNYHEKVQFSYAGNTNNNGDLDVQNIPGPPAAGVIVHHQPPPPPSLDQVIQSLGHHLQDERDRPTNGVILHHRQQHHHLHHPMASFNQQFFNAAGQYHPTSDTNPGRNNAAEMDSSQWTGNSQ